MTPPSPSTLEALGKRVEQEQQWKMDQVATTVRLTDHLTTLTTERDALKEHIRWLLPLAKGYAADNQAEINQEIIWRAEESLTPSQERVKSEEGGNV